MSASDPIKLPDDPLKAMHEIKGYLRSLSKAHCRAAYDSHDEEIVGYWQTEEWLDGLLDIANECERILARHGICSTCQQEGMKPSHNGSKRCESGSIASGGDKDHCSCDICF